MSHSTTMVPTDTTGPHARYYLWISCVKVAPVATAVIHSKSVPIRKVPDQVSAARYLSVH